MESDYLSRSPVLPGDKPEQEDNSRKPIRTVNTLALNEIKLGQIGIEEKGTDEIKEGVILRRVRGKKEIVLNDKAGTKIMKSIHKKFGHWNKTNVRND